MKGIVVLISFALLLLLSPVSALNTPTYAESESAILHNEKEISPGNPEFLSELDAFFKSVPDGDGTQNKYLRLHLTGFHSFVPDEYFRIYKNSDVAAGMLADAKASGYKALSGEEVGLNSFNLVICEKLDSGKIIVGGKGKTEASWEKGKCKPEPTAAFYTMIALAQAAQKNRDEAARQRQVHLNSMRNYWVTYTASRVSNYRQMIFNNIPCGLYADGQTKSDKQLECEKQRDKLLSTVPAAKTVLLGSDNTCVVNAVVVENLAGLSTVNLARVIDAVLLETSGYPNQIGKVNRAAESTGVKTGQLNDVVNKLKSYPAFSRPTAIASAQKTLSSNIGYIAGSRKAELLASLQNCYAKNA
jgi:hypothetical protein